MSEKIIVVMLGVFLRLQLVVLNESTIHIFINKNFANNLIDVSPKISTQNNTFTEKTL